MYERVSIKVTKLVDVRRLAIIPENKYIYWIYPFFIMWNKKIYPFWFSDFSQYQKYRGVELADQIRVLPVKTSNSSVAVIMSMSCGLNTASLDHQRWVGWPPVIGGGTGGLRCLREQFLNIPHPDHHHPPTSYTQKRHSFDSTLRDDSDE